MWPIVKVTLVEPGARFHNFYSAFQKHLPLMGSLYLGTLLKQQGHDVTIYNENIGKIDYSDIKDSDVLGVSILSTTAPRGYEIAERFRSLNPKGRVFIGGPHATFLPEEAAQYADHVVLGEGETVIADLVKSGGDRIVQGHPVANLDDLPFPDFSLIRGFTRHITPVSTSRGCPHNCTFCSVTPMFGRKYRFRSTESVMEELARSKHHHIFFYDDSFASNKKRTKELLSQMIEGGITPKWTTQVRADDVAHDEELVQMMAAANCGRLCIGFESVNEEMLERYGKKQTLEDITKCLDLLHKYRIRVHGMFISEGYSRVYDKLGLDSLQLCVLIPLVGSKLYDRVKDAGRLLSDRFPEDWALFDGVHVVHWPDNMSPLEMQKQTMDALRGFYSRLSVAKLLLKGQFGEGFLRAMGHRTLSRWEKQNREFMAGLRRISERAQSYSNPLGPAESAT
jgi:radical SAM superfamily enzyme YgiQ (UPF0313 family)